MGFRPRLGQVILRHSFGESNRKVRVGDVDLPFAGDWLEHVSNSQVCGSSAIANDVLWKKFLEMLRKDVETQELADTLSNVKYATNPNRVVHHEELKFLITKWTEKNDVKVIIETLTNEKIPSCEIRLLSETAVDPHIALYREMVVDMIQPGIGDVKLSGCPVKMSRTAPTPGGPAPSLGEHTEEVLCNLLGFTKEQVANLRQKKVL